ncbi:MSMEG_0570 family nitrogen starvation response protein [Frigoribacterium sp. PhB160]|uniref:MSMEG_0570 family nitrogen starvation response protein n=1 Tax=Frigoribacterium sp. PhB160 TaxID=2485192 RepID=UPI001F399595|nr:MSMEG_0570 family nitrogen starvation response protein [Frigoribacterium sp. PhB160]
MTFRVRWPDGTETSCYSPSLVVHDHLVTGAEYPLAEFVERSTTALRLAGERVAAAYGFACTSALQQEADIVAAAARHAGGAVRVVEMHPPLPVPATAAAPPASSSVQASVVPAASVSAASGPGAAS